MKLLGKYEAATAEVSILFSRSGGSPYMTVAKGGTMIIVLLIYDCNKESFVNHCYILTMLPLFALRMEAHCTKVQRLCLFPRPRKHLGHNYDIPEDNRLDSGTMALSLRTMPDQTLDTVLILNTYISPTHTGAPCSNQKSNQPTHPASISNSSTDRQTDILSNSSLDISTQGNTNINSNNVSECAEPVHVRTQRTRLHAMPRAAC